MDINHNQNMATNNKQAVNVPETKVDNVKKVKQKSLKLI